MLTWPLHHVGLFCLQWSRTVSTCGMLVSCWAMESAIKDLAQVQHGFQYGVKNAPLWYPIQQWKTNILILYPVILIFSRLFGLNISGCFLKWGYPQIIYLMELSSINHPSFDIRIYGKPHIGYPRHHWCRTIMWAPWRIWDTESSFVSSVGGLVKFYVRVTQW